MYMHEHAFIPSPYLYAVDMAAAANEDEVHGDVAVCVRAGAFGAVCARAADSAAAAAAAGSTTRQWHVMPLVCEPHAMRQHAHYCAARHGAPPPPPGVAWHRMCAAIAAEGERRCAVLQRRCRSAARPRGQ